MRWKSKQDRLGLRFAAMPVLGVLSLSVLPATLLAQEAPAAGASQQAAQAAGPRPAQPSQQSPAAAAQAAAKPKADANAFPEAESQAAEKEATAADKSADAGPAKDDAAGDSAGEASSSSRTRMKGLDLLGDHDSRASDGAGGVVSNPALAKEDVRIGQLYMGLGNYPGAYSRFKEATQVGPGNAEAVFYLAEAARKTAHLDEAAENYKLYLDVEPKGKRAKDARKALTELAGK